MTAASSAQPLSILLRAYDTWLEEDRPSAEQAREALRCLRLAFLESTRKGGKVLSIPLLVSSEGDDTARLGGLPRPKLNANSNPFAAMPPLPPTLLLGQHSKRHHHATASPDTSSIS